MRQLFMAVCALSLTLVACKKDTAPVKTGSSGSKEKVALKITTNDFLQRVEALPGGRKTGSNADAARDSVLATKVSDLYYMLYDDSGNHIKTIQQNANTPGDFGNFYDTVAPGFYWIVLLASQSPLDLNLNAQLPGSSFSVPVGASGEIESMPDIFYSKSSVWVPVDRQDAMEFHLTLDRIVGGLEIYIRDVPHADVADNSISITITPEANTFNLDPGIINTDGVLLHNAKVKRINESAFSAYVLNTESELSITFNYVDPATGEPRTRRIDNVRCYRNRRTILSGYLYGSTPPNGGVRVILLDSWNGPLNEIEF